MINFTADDVLIEGVDLDLSGLIAVDHFNLPGLLAFVILQGPLLPLSLLGFLLCQFGSCLPADSLVQVQGRVGVILVEFAGVTPGDFPSLSVNCGGVFLVFIKSVDLVLIAIALWL